MHILMIGNDPKINSSIQNSLKYEGYIVDCVQVTFIESLSFIDESCDLIILDNEQPNNCSTKLIADICLKKLRIPLLVLAEMDDLTSRINILEAGADDYLKKPFDMAELATRIRVLLRRDKWSGQVIRVGNLSLNPASHEVWLNNNNISMSIREFSLLRIFMENPDRIFSRNELERRLYNLEHDVASNVIEFFISSLRRKIGKTQIHNRRGVGWFISSNLQVEQMQENAGG